MSKPKRILLTTFGSFGDIHPYMAIALELVALGHLPVIGTSARYRGKIESAGIGFVPIRPDLPSPEDAPDIMRRVMDSKTGSEAVLKLMTDGIADSYADTLEAAHDTDIIVSHVLTYASPIVAEKLDLPWVFTALQPLVFFSGCDPATPAQAPWFLLFRIFGADFYRKVMDVGFRMIAHWADPILKLRDSLGLPKSVLSPIYRGQFSPYLNLALFAKEFAAPQPDWPANSVQTGFPYYDANDSSQKQMSDGLLKFLDGGDAPIVFTLGTAAVRDAGRFYHESADAARKIGKRAVLLTGIETANAADIDLGNDLFVADYAPFSQIFPRAAVNVHQGGIGTTAQALRAGRPMLVMPYAHDQPDNAARIERLGVGKHILKSRYSAANAASALSVLLNDPRYANKAAQIGNALQSEPGAVQGAKQIVSVLD